MTKVGPGISDVTPAYRNGTLRKGVNGSLRTRLFSGTISICQKKWLIRARVKNEMSCLPTFDTLPWPVGSTLTAGRIRLFRRADQSYNPIWFPQNIRAWGGL